MPNHVAELLDLLIAKAPALIAAGVTHVSVSGMSADLTSPPQSIVVAPQSNPPVFLDPLNDPATFPGGRVPGFRREEPEL